MPRIVTADLHLSENPRDAYRHAFMKRLRDLAKQRRAERIYILGDLTEEKDRHSGWLVNAVVDELQALAEVCPVVVMMGNHDYVADPTHAFYTFLRHIPNISWMINPTSHEGCLFLPHSRNYKRDWRDVKLTGWDWIFAHQTFDGANIGPRKLEGIPTSIFPDDAQVIAGDIHVPQTLGPVTYVGAPYLVDFGDDYTPRVLLLEGNQAKSIKCPGPQKRLVEMTAHMESEGPTFTIEHVAGADKPAKGDVLKVRVDLGIASREDWPQIREAVYEWGKDNDFAIHSVSPVAAKVATRARAKVTRARKTDEEILREYAKQRGLDKAVLTAGLELLSDA